MQYSDGTEGKALEQLNRPFPPDGGGIKIAVVACKEKIVSYHNQVLIGIIKIKTIFFHCFNQIARFQRIVRIFRQPADCAIASLLSATLKRYNVSEKHAIRPPNSA